MQDVIFLDPNGKTSRLPIRVLKNTVIAEVFVHTFQSYFQKSTIFDCPSICLHLHNHNILTCNSRASKHELNLTEQTSSNEKRPRFQIALKARRVTIISAWTVCYKRARVMSDDFFGEANLTTRSISLSTPARAYTADWSLTSAGVMTP